MLMEVLPGKFRKGIGRSRSERLEILQVTYVEDRDTRKPKAAARPCNGRSLRKAGLLSSLHLRFPVWYV